MGERGSPRDLHRPDTASSTRTAAVASGSVWAIRPTGSGAAGCSTLVDPRSTLTCCLTVPLPPLSASFSARAALSASRRYPHSSSSLSTSERSRPFSADTPRHRVESCARRSSTEDGTEPRSGVRFPARSNCPTTSPLTAALSSIMELDTPGGVGGHREGSVSKRSGGGASSSGGGRRLSSLTGIVGAASGSVAAYVGPSTTGSSFNTRSSSTGVYTASSLTVGVVARVSFGVSGGATSFVTGALMSWRPPGTPTHLAEHTGHLVSVANQSSAQSPQRWWPHAVTLGALFVASRRASTPSRQMLVGYKVLAWVSDRGTARGARGVDGATHGGAR